MNKGFLAKLRNKIKSGQSVKTKLDNLGEIRTHYLSIQG